VSKAEAPGSKSSSEDTRQTMVVSPPMEKSSVQFRAKFFNMLDHSQFANPDTNFNSLTFGPISSPAVNPRVIQPALKLAF
jgi:hypothetical protein